MSHISYDSHVVTRRRMADELPRVRQQQQGEAGAGGLVDLGAGTGPGYTETMMDSEIQRVSRELYKAFSGKNPGFAEVSYSHYLLQRHMYISHFQRQRIRLQLMNFPLTRTLEDKKPFIHTR